MHGYVSYLFKLSLLKRYRFHFSYYYEIWRKYLHCKNKGNSWQQNYNCMLIEYKWSSDLNFPFNRENESKKFIDLPKFFHFLGIFKDMRFYLHFSLCFSFFFWVITVNTVIFTCNNIRILLHTIFSLSTILCVITMKLMFY